MKKIPDNIQLYFIAIVPPSPIYEEALRLKNYFKDQYNSKASLNSPPHITLHMPFQWKVEKESILNEALERFAQQFSAFDLQLLNFNCFGPRVIYIDVVKNEKLDAIQKELQRFCKRELNLFNANYKEHVFHAHLTLAFRDLRKQEFRKAWEEFTEMKFDASFKASQITLLKHNGKFWEDYKSFDFKQTWLSVRQDKTDP